MGSGNVKGRISEKRVRGIVSDRSKKLHGEIVPYVVDVRANMDYDELENKPTIEGVTVEHDKLFSDYNLNGISNTEIDIITG